MIKERNYGVDVLRLVLMYMVCILHVLGNGGVLASCQLGSLNYKVYWFLEILSYCAVDGFAIISGYMAVNRARKYEKLVDMWFQVFFYSFILTLIFTVFGMNENWSKVDMIKCALPMTFGKYWYFTAFFALFLAIPILNKFIFSIDETIAKKVFIILIALFSFCGVVADPFKSYNGYSAIWLMVLYLIGALAKKIKLFEKRKSWSLIALWLGCIFITWVMKVFIGRDFLINYVSPTILGSGLIMVILFSRIRIKGTIISKLSPLAFGIYLFQLNQVIWDYVINGACSFVVNKSIVIGVAYVFLCALLVFVSGLLVEFLRSKIAKLIRIPLLSKKIVTLIDIFMNKIIVFLK